MAERFNGQRVHMRDGRQRVFLDNIKERLHASWPELAVISGVSVRTLCSWRNEEYSIPLQAFTELQRRSGVSWSEEYEIVEAYWHTKRAAALGGMAAYRKYGRVGGDPERRKERWRQWWQSTGKTRQHPILYKPIPIRRPKKSSALAEWVGIMLGDGGITDYQVTVTLNRFDDRKYVQFVIQLTQQLFGVKPRCYNEHSSRAVNLVISRKQLVRFCTEELGLVKGNKVRQRIDIPTWIHRKSVYERACVRGLVDTDGSVFIHRYNVKGKMYAYRKIGFTSHSPPLLQSMFRILKQYGLKPHHSANWNIRLDDVRDVAQYFKIFSSHNQKHLNRYAG